MLRSGALFSQLKVMFLNTVILIHFIGCDDTPKPQMIDIIQSSVAV